MKPIIYVVKNKYGLTDNQRNLFLSFASENRKKRIMQVQSPQKADNMLLAETLLKCAVNKEFNIPFEKLAISYQKGGKPYFFNCENIHFSISHCDEYVAVALCDRPVGIDIQKIGNFPKKVAERVCSEAELSLLSCAKNKGTLFTKLWTQKEAVLKMQGCGIFNGSIRNAPGNHKTESVQIEDYWLTICVSD